MRILIDIWSLASENGGPTRSAKGLVRALAQAGTEVFLVSHVPGKVPDEEIADLARACVAFREGRGIKYRVAFADSIRLLDEIKPDIVHIQGMWKMSTHAMNVAASKRGIPIVISPRGMLDPWALSVKRLKKRLGMLLYQKGDLKRATAFHAACADEAEHIRDFGLRQPIITVPNGVAFPRQDVFACGEHGEHEEGRMKNKSEYAALFLSRLHPGKGLMLLAEAWAKVRPQGWKMIVAGSNEQRHREAVEARLAELGIADDWQFVGEVSDREKWKYYVAADLFVHPSASENFGISIAEALASGVPVITTKGCPWSEIDGKCGWWIDRSVACLADCLQKAMSLSDGERQAMGQKGVELIQEKYTWSAIGRQMLAAYGKMGGNRGC